MNDYCSHIVRIRQRRTLRRAFVRRSSNVCMYKCTHKSIDYRVLIVLRNLSTYVHIHGIYVHIYTCYVKNSDLYTMTRAFTARAKEPIAADVVFFIPSNTRECVYVL